MRVLLLIVVIALLSTTILAERPEPTGRFKAIAERVVDAINKEDYKAVRQDFGKAMLKAFPEDEAKAFFGGLR